MLNQKPQIKVLIIGKDGQARKHWVDHDAQFYDNRYKIDFDAVYQSTEGGFLGYGSKQVPTIMFRENNVLAISYRVKPSQPDPDEMGSSISRAAWAIAELMRKKNEQLMQWILILAVVACACAGASAYLGYVNGQKIDKIQNSINSLQIQNSTGGNSPFFPITITPTPTSSKTPTKTPTLTPTPTRVAIR